MAFLVNLNCTILLTKIGEKPNLGLLVCLLHGFTNSHSRISNFTSFSTNQKSCYSHFLLFFCQKNLIGKNSWKLWFRNWEFSCSGCETPFMKNERCAHLSMEFKVEKWQRLGLKSTYLTNDFRSSDFSLKLFPLHWWLLQIEVQLYVLQLHQWSKQVKWDTL